MTDEKGWSIVYYTTADGKKPVTEFLGGLDEKTQSKFAALIERLRVINVQAREPMVRHIESKVWELRLQSDKNIYRVMYFFFVGKRVVLLHGFQKKTQKTPR